MTVSIAMARSRCVRSRWRNATVRAAVSLALGLLLTGALNGAVVAAERGTADAGVAPGAGGVRVVLLGTGTPNADPARSGPALAVVVDGVPYLVDAGPGVVRRAAAAAQQGEASLAVDRLERVFLTHLHSDHTAGLPDLFLTPWVLERDAPLAVWGPEGTVAMTAHIRAAWVQDIHMRLFGMEPANDGGHRFVARDIKPGRIHQDERVTVDAFAVNHGSWPQALGYRFATADTVIVVSGDTAPADSVVSACNGCDILVHEVYARAGWERRDAHWQRYHAAFHTSGIELGRLAERAGAGTLVLTHQLLWGASEAQLLEEVREGYSGKLIYGRDLLVIEPSRGAQRRQAGHGGADTGTGVCSRDGATMARGACDGDALIRE